MNPCLLHFPKITDPRGNLSFLQNPGQLPFTIGRRVFWTYDTPSEGKSFVATNTAISLNITGNSNVLGAYANATIYIHSTQLYNLSFLD